MDWRFLHKYHSERQSCMSLLTRLSPLKSLRRAFTRVINIENVPPFDQYDHMSNMKTKDLFQFEPFDESDLIVIICLIVGHRLFLEKDLVKIMI